MHDFISYLSLDDYHQICAQLLTCFPKAKIGDISKLKNGPQFFSLECDVSESEYISELDTLGLASRSCWIGFSTLASELSDIEDAALEQTLTGSTTPSE